MKTLLSHFVPGIEILESRIAPAVIMVSIATDGSQPGTLRYAITHAVLSNTSDTILFSPLLNGQLITLTSALPEITKSMAIVGQGSAKTIIDGAGAGSNSYGVFNIGLNGAKPSTSPSPISPSSTARPPSAVVALISLIRAAPSLSQTLLSNQILPMDPVVMVQLAALSLTLRETSSCLDR